MAGQLRVVFKYFSVGQLFNSRTSSLEGQRPRKKHIVPWSKVAILGMVIPPLIGNPYDGYINPYYWVDDHPLLYGNNGSLDPGTYNFPRCSMHGIFTYIWVVLGVNVYHTLSIWVY